MSDYVEMTHPKLPGRVIRIRASKTGPRLAGGWEIKTQEPTKTEPKRASKRRSDATDKNKEA